MTILTSLIQSALTVLTHLASLGSGALILLAATIVAWMITRKAKA